MKFSFLVLLTLLSASSFADGWNSLNDPRNMSDHYTYRFNQLPMTGAVDANHMPWSDNYWESDWGGISLRWNTLTVAQRDPDLFEYRTVNRDALFQYSPPSLAQLRSMSRDELLNLSPAEKYDILMGRYDYPTVMSERQRTDPGMRDWQGICHGWVPAAINEKEPQPMDMPNADGIIIPFASSDIKGLLSYYYGVTGYQFARGARKVVRNGSFLQYLNSVDGTDSPSWINLDANATVWSNRLRVTPTNSTDSAPCANPSFWASYGSMENCIVAYSFQSTVDDFNLVGQVGARNSGGDPNAGAFFIVMANQLGLEHAAFAANLNRSGHGNQIWNQPVSGYNTTMDYDHRDGLGGTVGLTTTLFFVSEIPQTYGAVVGTPAQRIEKMVFSYELTLDQNGNVTDGSWSSRLHPSFLWKHGKLPIQGYFSKLLELNP
jgi:hypothetical protein